MNRINLATVLFVALPSFVFCQQPWAKPGAHWYYQVGIPGSITNNANGYMEIKKEGDTLLNGISCDLLSVHYHFQQLWPGGQLMNYYDPDMYTYRNGDTVYISYGGSFDVLFITNAQPGSYWISAGDPWGTCPGDTIPVDSLQTVNIAGFTMNRIVPIPFYLLPYFASIYHHEPFYERFGSIQYFYPMPTCITDIEGGPLRCYSDSLGFSYSTNIAPYCDYVTGIDNGIASQDMPSISPTIVTNELLVDLKSIPHPRNAEISIYSQFGNLCMISRLKHNQTKLLLSGLSAGLYICTIRSPVADYKMKFIKQ